MSATESFEQLLATGESIAPPPGVAAWAPIADHDAWIAEAAADPITFWRACGQRIAWDTKPSQVLDGDPRSLERVPKWFGGGRLNATVSCLDRHAASHPDSVAYLYLCEDGTEKRTTYRELLGLVSRYANALRADGVRAGDRVCIYMPLSLEGIVAMLACARIGAVHSVVYAGLGATALRDRIADADATVVIGADLTYRRGKTVDLDTILAHAVIDAPSVRRVVMWRRAHHPRPLGERERDFVAYAEGQPETCDPEIVDANDPLFILYTSGTTGKPKGVVMTHGGYLAGASTMLAYVTGLTPDDVYWCTSDIGWIVGHSLIVYGALANRLMSIIREGAPDFPSPAAFYEVVQKHRVTKVYTAPTLARMLMRHGGELAQKHDLSSLQYVACAGEPLNPEAWHFLFDVVGRGNVAVCNQWWQTETGAMMLGYLPTSAIRPDRSGKALGPIAFDIVDAGGTKVPPGYGGLLIVREPWPHMFAGVWGDSERYAQYFEQIPGVYLAGDVATCDAEGFYSVLGRAYDVLNVAGHRIATADVESALVSHPSCGEAGVIGKPDDIKGEAIKAFVVLRAGFAASDTLRDELIAHVRYNLGPIGAPAELDFVAKLPKTRSGKIMRRLLKAQETGASVGDVTTLEE